MPFLVWTGEPRQHELAATDQNDSGRRLPVVSGMPLIKEAEPVTEWLRGAEGGGRVASVCVLGVREGGFSASCRPEDGETSPAGG